MRYLRTGGRKGDENQITAEGDLEISRLKDVIAEITQENLEIKDLGNDCRRGERHEIHVL